MIKIVFGIIATLGLLTALGSVLVRNLIHAALLLVGFFFLVACTFVLLEAEFMAAMQVLIYIGAIAILLLFGIMLTRNIQGDETTGGHWSRKAPAGVIAAGLFAVLALGIVNETGIGKRAPWSAVNSRDAAGPSSARATAISNMGKAVGDDMMTRFAIPFEIAGLLLTAALVGAIALAQSEEDETRSRAEAPVNRRAAAPIAGNGPLQAVAPATATPSSSSEPS